MRPTRNENLMEVASVIARRGTCDSKQVGAVIAREGRIISVGFNGAPPGLPHCDENYHGYLQEVREQVIDPDHMPKSMEVLLSQGCRNATHAEANALAFAAKYGVSTDGAELFVTVSPCDVCARLLIAAGIVTVYFLERYRDSSGLEVLNQARGLDWWQLES